MREEQVLLKFLPIEGEIGDYIFLLGVTVLCTDWYVLFSYKDIFPFDYNRVSVFPYKIAGDSEPSDYINASFVSDVFSGAPRKYIAAQVV